MWNLGTTKFLQVLRMPTARWKRDPNWCSQQKSGPNSHIIYRLAAQATGTLLPAGDSTCWFLPSRSTIGDVRESWSVAEGQLKQERTQVCRKSYCSGNYLPFKSMKSAKTNKITWNISTGKGTLRVLQMPGWNYLLKIRFVIKIKPMLFQIHNRVIFKKFN